MSKILRIFACLFALFFVVDASGAGYTCSASAKKYTSCKSGYYMYGGTGAGNSCKKCPTGYPNSAGGTGGIKTCYSNTKSRAWTGSQVNGSTPSGCASVTAWNACSKPACSYVAYSNSAGTGDGTIKSGCSSNCQCDGYNMYTVKLHENAKDSHGQYEPLRQWCNMSDVQQL